MAKYRFTVEGMSCSHCEHAVETAVGKIAGVSKVKANATKGIAEVTASAEAQVKSITTAIEDAGYSVKGTESADDEEESHSRESSPMQFIGVVIVIAAVLMIVKNTVGFSFIPAIPASATYSLIFVAGLLTSLHCVAMCGGIALSQCVGKAACPTRFSGILPSSLYNAGRVVSYTATGVIVGALGSAVGFSSNVKGWIMIVAGIFMALMGLRYLGIIDLIPRLRIKLPFFVSDKSSGRFSPLVVGLLNGLMPCGPLQAMQLFALGTGSALVGALSMMVFALGTVPLMFVIGAVSTLLSKRFTRQMFRASGAVLLVLAMIMVTQGLNLKGTQLMARTTQTGAAIAKIQGNEQIVISSLTSNSYQPIIVQKGIPVKWTIRAAADDLNGCNKSIVIPEYKIQKNLVAGDNLIEFTPTHDGIVGFTCWMGMISSSIGEVSDITKADGSLPGLAANAKSRGGCCGGGGQLFGGSNGSFPARGGCCGR